ncbi:MAG: NADH-quinone oxidoreductase subunit H [Rhodoferax sp.]|uniref:respiratory chain complex I subunit 1 family protein n=1 Tax=Rhodoferax sp. TaxID=50421 RepID=UPI001B4873F9|nr:NADH-quinone oxidoreductase subunit H [Rhodoferax sp.]MBP9149391.1 NADH-quinone oxidoreductase subunit H [Rhodoferax sp.]MBP9738035.1 NADH-quinone oxidoreductase subunit H [Rhodoferax sp.]
MNAPVLLTLAHIVLVLGMPFLLIGVINRTKSWWAARKGPGLLQSFHDLRRLLRKRPVVSHTTTPLFRASAWAVLACGLLAMGFAPMLGQFAPLSFAHDFVAMAYTLGLARLVQMLAAMDVGSPFEGMGAAREAMFGAFAEPALFLLLGTLSAATGLSSFSDLLGHLHHTPYYALIVAPLALALLILLQTEAARVPVDDPQTHLELTMIHEVMILDHSGPDLAAMQYAAGLKLTLYCGLIATLLNPFDPLVAPVAAIATSIGLMLAVAVVVGCFESLMARLPLKWVTGYVWVAGWLTLVAAAVVGVTGGGL